MTTGAQTKISIMLDNMRCYYEKKSKPWKLGKLVSLMLYIMQGIADRIIVHHLKRVMWSWKKGRTLRQCLPPMIYFRQLRVLFPCGPNHIHGEARSDGR